MTRALVVAVACVLLLMAADRVVRAVAAIQRPVEAMYGESIIYDQAARLVRGEPLYQPLDQSPFTVAAYSRCFSEIGTRPTCTGASHNGNAPA